MRRSSARHRVRALIAATLATGAAFLFSCGKRDSPPTYPLANEALPPASTADEEDRTGVPGEVNPMPRGPESDGGPAASGTTEGGMFERDAGVP